MARHEIWDLCACLKTAGGCFTLNQSVIETARHLYNETATILDHRPAPVRLNSEEVLQIKRVLLEVAAYDYLKDRVANPEITASWPQATPKNVASWTVDSLNEMYEYALEIGLIEEEPKLLEYGNHPDTMEKK